MFNPRKLAIALTAGLFVSQASAGEGVADEIARINEQIAVLSAQVKELDLRLQIATKRAEIERLAGGGAAGMSGELPVVRGIEGIDGKLKATLVFAGGIQQTVAKGETTRGGWTVAEINVNSVSLVRGKEKVRLGFGNEPPPSPADASAGPGGVRNR
ncbi:MAG: pilus assembly protein PilP [Pseudomonadota bacterium]|jgi:type IV pilus biogenesis protein PilP